MRAAASLSERIRGWSPNTRTPFSRRRHPIMCTKHGAAQVSLLAPMASVAPFQLAQGKARHRIELCAVENHGGSLSPMPTTATIITSVSDMSSRFHGEFHGFTFASVLDYPSIPTSDTLGEMDAPREMLDPRFAAGRSYKRPAQKRKRSHAMYDATYTGHCKLPCASHVRRQR